MWFGGLNLVLWLYLCQRHKILLPLLSNIPWVCTLAPWTKLAATSGTHQNLAPSIWKEKEGKEGHMASHLRRLPRTTFYIPFQLTYLWPELHCMMAPNYTKVNQIGNVTLQVDGNMLTWQLWLNVTGNGTMKTGPVDDIGTKWRNPNFCSRIFVLAKGTFSRMDFGRQLEVFSSPYYIIPLSFSTPIRRRKEPWLNIRLRSHPVSFWRDGYDFRQGYRYNWTTWRMGPGMKSLSVSFISYSIYVSRYISIGNLSESKGIPAQYVRDSSGS